MLNRKQLAQIRLVAWLFIGIGLCVYFLLKNPATNSPPVHYTLLDKNGKAVSEKDFIGKPQLVFFGFTHCPDVCPTTLDFMGAILNDLGAGAAHITPLFISIDPAHDTPAIMADYLKAFDGRIIGLTGDAAALGMAQKSFSAYAKESTNGYDHTAVLYLLDGRGHIIETITQADGITVALKKIKKLIGE